MGKKKKAKTGNRLPLLIGLGALALIGLYLFNQTRRISVGAASFRVHKISLTNIELRVFLQIINESRLALDVTGFLGQIFYKGSAIGVVTQLQPVRLAAFATGQIEFKSDLSIVSLGTELFNIIRNKAQFDPNQLTIRGTLRAEGLDIPVNENLLTA